MGSLRPYERSKLVVTYKYVISQGPVHRTFKEAISSWIVKQDSFFTIGGQGLFVSPIYFMSKTATGFIQPHIDLDGELNEQNWNFIMEFCEGNNFFPVFTGKRGVQLYGKFLIRVHNYMRLSPSQLRTIVFMKAKVNPESLGQATGLKVDIPLCTTKQPTPRIGWRVDTKTFMFPILSQDFKDWEFFSTIVSNLLLEERLRRLKEMINIESYLTNFICPLSFTG